MKLDFKKVLAEIDNLKKLLEERLNKKENFKDIHQKVLRLCKEIFSTKKEYKKIDKPYPMVVEIIFRNPLNGQVTKSLNNEAIIWKQKTDLGKDILSILKEAREIFSLRLKLHEG